MKSRWVTLAIAAGLGAIGLPGVGLSSGAAASGSKSLSSDNAFCYPAVKMVGTYSVNVEWALGFNDDRPLPSAMTPKIRTAVRALAKSSLAVSRRAPSEQLAVQLRRLSIELKQSKRPIDVVRAEAAFGATGYPALSRVCPSTMMIMTATNPLGGFNPE
jgi:hypothetical protein